MLKPSKHGFRPNHSKVTAMLEIVNKWFHNIDIGQLNRVVFRLQNTAVRIITNSGYEVRSVNLLNQLGWPNLQTRRNHQLDQHRHCLGMRRI